MPTTYTPLRYPGGKSKIYPLVASLIEYNGLRGCTYAEPFAGGAGLAMKLLLRGDVSRVILNDLDPAVYSIWETILHRPDQLCEFIQSVPVTMETWERCREEHASAKGPSFELGKAAFFLNRTNRSGILAGGVIGGKGQTGRYKLDARFNRDDLCRKVLAISSRSMDIRLYHVDARDFLQDVAPTLGDESLLYLDPPYVEKGPGLYEYRLSADDHRGLAKALKEYSGKWALTYDADALVDELYTPSHAWPITTSGIKVGYSTAKSRDVATERLVLGPGMRMPG